MKRLLGVALGILTAIGGFVDIGDLVTNALVGSRFGLSLAWATARRRRGHLPVRRDVRRVAAISGRGDVRPGPRAPRAAGRAGEPARVVAGDDADLHRRDRRHRPGAGAGDRASTTCSSCPLSGCAVWLVMWRVKFSIAGERFRAARPRPDRVRLRAVAARSGLGRAAAPGGRIRTSLATRRSRRTSTTRSRCSARR